MSEREPDLSTVTKTSEIVSVPSTTNTNSPPLANPNSTQIGTIPYQPLPVSGDQTVVNPPPPKSKRSSFFTRKSKSSLASAATSNPAGTGTAIIIYTAAEHHALCKSIDQDLSFITENCKKLDIYKDRVNEEAEKARYLLESLKSNDENKDELRMLKRRVNILKVHISSIYKEPFPDPHWNKRLQDSAKLKQISEDETDEFMKTMSQFYKRKELTSSTQFQDFKKAYDGLRIELKLCLLCFAVFPEGAVIKKRFMIYWWMGEKFVPPIENGNEKTAEEFANEFFYELMEKNFIQPVFKKRYPLANSCRMHPFIRSIVLQLAVRAKFFDFGDEGNPTEKYEDSFRACLVGRGLVNPDNLENIHMLFNIDEQILDFKHEWFLRMKNINLLSLGRWQTSHTRRILIDETSFLDGLSAMKHLSLFSLQGVSKIMELPKSISHLVNLTIMDLRACHNLEVIPNEIGMLKSLTHLDMSECYLLEHMPKELSKLTNLQVLKGFVAGVPMNKNSCTLNDLAKLQKLRKFNIYTGLMEFPFDDDLCALQEFKSLRKLTIAWCGSASHDIEGKGNGNKTESRRLEKLEKLDLQCFPLKHATNWFTPRDLKGLKKLYIRGGELRDLCQYMDFKERWNTEVLRIKYLAELEMNWKEMQELFPNLIYLEKVNCPKLTFFFPCDASGVWMNKTKLKQLHEI